MDFLRLAAYLKLDKSEYEEGLKDAENRAKGFGSKLASGLGNATKAIGAATVAGAVAVGKVVKESVAAFGEFQQLEGGIQTLFGEDAPAMLNNASKAFKTAGVSANQYMEMAIQSSAAMITSLEGDTAEAAELMDQTIIDMSDNVNKMGTSMEAVQNAYKGFSRGNFTMLDNLALGYAGTKEGMQQLLDRANEINKAHGVMSDYAIDSYANIVEAIHIVQNEMGITGTTAKEAGDTITGSAGSAKAAWEDLKVAMASGDDSKLTAGIDNLINSVTVFAQNIIPIVENALVGVGTAIEKIAPIIAERLPGLVENMLPSLLSAAASLVQGVVNALPALLQTLLKILPNLIKQIITAIRKVLPDILKAIMNGLKTFIPEMWKMGAELLTELANGISESLPELVMLGLDVLESLIDGIMNNLPKIATAAFELIEKLISSIIERLPEILERGKDILLKLVQGIRENLPKLVSAAVELIKKLAKTIIDNLPEILQAGIQLILELGKGILEALPDLLAQVPQIIIDLVGALLNPENIGKIIDAGFQMIGSLFDGLFSGDFGETAGKIIEALLGAVLAIPGMIMDIGSKIVGFIFDGIKSAWNGVVDWVESGIEALFGDVNKARDEALAALNSAYTDEYYAEKRQGARNRAAEKSGTTGMNYAGAGSQVAIYSTTYIGGKKLNQTVTTAGAGQNAKSGGH